MGRLDKLVLERGISRLKGRPRCLESTSFLTIRTGQSNLQPERLRYSLGNYQGPACPYRDACCTCSGMCQLWGRGRGRMPPRRGARRAGGRGGKGAGRCQPEEKPVVPPVDPNAPVTQANLAAMEQRYQDMLQAALAPFLAAQQN
ncbi:uncharacterized protein E6C27_scaffold218G00070 [Cucumis melo var. makuwa]|uniref:Gag protease polyprotein n=1 Tax=Cucumis melo var. makuwa TaxID=1194695 RepID=A0A5A7SMB0_CUCMM|nr:uncharacterized protein E6C27_scaffold218G00070 [Cucumis melo var. makuwa]